MRQLLLSLIPITLLMTLACSRPDPGKGTKPAGGDGGKVVVAPPAGDKVAKATTNGVTTGAKQPEPEKEPAEDSNDDKYEAALTEGLMQMADQNWSQALLSFQAAQRFNDTQFIRGEIAKLKQRVDQEAAAEKTVSDIEKVLEEGKAAEAVQLAHLALKEFGDGDASDQLVKLRLQADALATASKREDDDTRIQRYRGEGEAALREQNLRAAAIAFEQAVQLRADARLQGQLDDIRDKLQKYDGLRRRAQELRRDPQQLEDALAALNDAARHWDTLQVRQEIDECNLALQKRRDNISVADFEVRVDVGFPDAGRTVAEELLPHFKSRFDLVERAQIGKLIEELKLEDSFDDDIDQQRELARLAKVRYLVLGSVRPLSGVTINARLVDARSGLVVQTAKVVAANVEEAIPLLPELAKQLLMSDEEKLAYDLAQARLAKRIEPPPDDAPLPPPPPPPAAAVVVVPPPVVEVPAPPPFAGVTFDLFRRLPPPPVLIKVAAPPPPTVVVNHRLLHASLHLGDDLFRRGRYAEAQRHFEFALNLSPGNFDLRLRLERTRPHLPPPVVVARPVVIVQPPPIIVRHRIAVLDFATFGDPRVVPPGLGPWTAHHLAPYFRSRYDVIDPSEVYWWMGRMGMSMRDLLVDAGARRWLARAVGVRYFVVGALVETASFNVHTYMIDAEFGYLHSSAHIHARNPRELKLRLGELAHLTMCDPGERTRIFAEQDRFNALIVRGRQHYDRRDFGVAVTVFEDALRLRPGHVEVLFHLTNARRQAEILALEEARRQQFLRQQALAAEAARRQWELARAAELARIRAAKEAVLLVEVDRRRLEENRLRAHQDLLVRARVAIKTNNFALAIDFFKGAADIVPARPVVVGFTPQQDIYRELALARAESERAAKVRAAQAAAVREAALRAEREKQLAIANAKLVKTKQALAASRQKADEERDRLLYQASFDEGQRLFGQGNYQAALSSFQAARRVKSTPQVDTWIKVSLQQQTLAGAKDANERKLLEAKLAAETERRKAAEAEAQRSQEAYQAALALAHKALAAKQYAVAETRYHEAGKFFKTDAVLIGLRKVEAARAEVAAKAKAGQDQTVRVKQLVAQGRSALDAKDYGKAIAAYQQAKKLAPDNVEMLAGLTQAEEARTRHAASAKRQAEDAARAKEFQRLLQSGRANLKAKQYDAAAVALTEALKLNPGDAAATAALKDAEAGRKKPAVDAKAAAAAKQKTEAYQKLIGDGRLALETKRYDDAIKSFSAAQKLLPGDQTSAGYLKEAQQAKSESVAAVAAAAKKRAEEIQRKSDVRRALTQGRTALAAKDLGAAAKAFAQAAKLAPGDADVERALRDLGQAQKLAQVEAAAQAKRDRQFQDLLTSGKKSFAAKKYDEAIKIFGEAAALNPDDKSARDLLRQAQKAQADASFADDVGKRARAEKVKDLLSTSRAALKKKDFDAAEKALNEARKLAPSDTDVARALRELSDARKTSDASKTDTEFQQALAAGQRAMETKNYKAAVQAYQAAAKLKPNDTRVPGLLEIALREQRRADAAATTLAEYNAYMAFGQKALATKNYKGAVKAFQEAARVMPGDPRAAALLKQAQVAARGDAKDGPKKKDDVKKKDDDEPKKAIKKKDDDKKKDDLKKKDDEPKKAIKKKDDDKKDDKKNAAASEDQQYRQFLTAGVKALKAKRYDDAVKWFTAAQKLMPDDPEPDQYLKQAQKLLKKEQKKKTSWLVPDESWRYEPPALRASVRRFDPAVSVARSRNGWRLGVQSMRLTA
ncbi:MAG: hypothetical protein L0Y71_15030 [Gemmataceae bacterium]|nr:hypothetical protein [Gemmataceae bacterium]